ncbi:hypothetical protein V6N12_059695 [Hibiscus sabdariffa]|uniref:Sugar phosphate transporter domain-containing protein n=1 Tax=Hibiscus sabdariffa TaxID=183260 RepID=A0ABR2EVU5_9ROSI
MMPMQSLILALSSESSRSYEDWNGLLILNGFHVMRGGLPIYGANLEGTSLDFLSLLSFLSSNFPRNAVTSVGIIMVNKALMATYGFSFATTLTGLHFATTTLLTVLLRSLGYIQDSYIPLPDLLKFVLFANFSIVGMNVSLMWNSVGFYQIAKLSMIPVSCFLEVVFDKVRYSRDTKLSIVLVLLGVAVCTVTDVSVNVKGFVAAVIAVWSTALQQYYVHSLQRKHSLGSFDLLGHTAPVQAASLLLAGPFVDYWLTEKKVYAYNYTMISMFFIILSCTIAVGTNLSQFICIGRFTAVSFQVLGHMKTILVLTLGFLFFGKEGLNLHLQATNHFNRTIYRSPPRQTRRSKDSNMCNKVKGANDAVDRGSESPVNPQHLFP